jgi:hypothetical protein
MTRQAFQESLIGFTNLATASGLHEAAQCHALMFTALALADCASKQGVSRECFARMAITVWDALRRSLRSGVQS